MKNKYKYKNWNFFPNTRVEAPTLRTTGFTLVESLVAVAILLIAVTTMSTVAQSGLSSTSNVRSRITAIFLAQEGLEGIKNIKDSNLLQISQSELVGDFNWLNNITTGGKCDYPDGCGYDIVSSKGLSSAMKCDPDNNNCELWFDTFYEYSVYRQGNFQGDEYSGFTRKIYVEETVQNAEARVRVVITKGEDPKFHYEIVTFMYNWF